MTLIQIAPHTWIDPKGVRAYHSKEVQPGLYTVEMHKLVMVDGSELEVKMNLAELQNHLMWIQLSDYGERGKREVIVKKDDKDIK